MHSFLEALRIQRWDDHRYYHHSRINQTLHLISALSFLTAYAVMFTNPAAAALLAWLVSMTSRQAGHFFFEPKGYDEVNQATHEHKEDIKVGYNLRRKIVLMSGSGRVTALLLVGPDAVRPLRCAPGSRRIHQPRRHDVAVGGLRWTDLPHSPPVLPA